MVTLVELIVIIELLFRKITFPGVIAISVSMNGKETPLNVDLFFNEFLTHNSV